MPRKIDGRAVGAPPASRIRAPHRRRAVALVVAVAVSGLCAPAGAQAPRWNASIGLQETFTNNVNLTPVGQSDWVTQITPGLSVNAVGPHSTLTGSISVPVLLYARTGSENNDVYPAVNLFGSVDLYEKIFKIEGSVNVSEQFYTPFGPTPTDLSNATNNRYRSSSYRVSPVLKGTTSNGIEYELRDDNVWTNLSGAPVSTNNAYYNEAIARLVGPSGRGPWNWRANYDFTETRFNNQQPIRTQVGRAVAVYNVDPMLELDASVGYESNDYTLTSSSNATYGAGFRWRPTPRTDVTALWEHRFFGSSYLFTFKHHTGLTVWSVDASRNITTYPQEVARLGAGTTVAGYLDQLYQSTIPDAAVRQETIDRFIQSRGLPTTLSDPVTLYAQQIQLQQRASASVGLVGARNTVFFTAFNLKTEPIDAKGNILPPLLAFGNNNTQTGFGVVWTSILAPTVNFLASVDGYRTVSNGQVADTTRQGTVRAGVSRQLSPRTSVYVGARYQRYVSDFFSNTDYNESAVFAGISHSFR
jgi:uncharacterized protein (PEP-CTERM system associated)